MRISVIAPPAGGATARWSLNRRWAPKFLRWTPEKRQEAPCGKQGKMQSAQKRIQQLRPLLQAPWCSHSEQLAHEAPQIVRHGGDEVAFSDFVDSSQPSAPRASGLADMRECPFHQFAALALQSLAAYSTNTSAVPINRFLL